MRRYFLCCAIAPVVVVTCLWAQENTGAAVRDTFDEAQQIAHLRAQPLTWFGSFTFAYSQPRGPFKQFLDSINNPWGLGFGFGGGYRFSTVPVMVGAMLDVLLYGMQERTYVRPGIPVPVYDTVRTSITFVPISIVARIAPDIGRVQPYIEACGGLTVIASNFSLSSNARSEQNVSHSHVPFQYSIGAGLNVRVVDVYNLPVSRQAYYVHCGVRYLFGDYSVYTFWKITDAGTVEPYRGASRTDLFVFVLGVQAEF